MNLESQKLGSFGQELDADCCRRMWIAVLTTYVNEIKQTQSLSHLKAILWAIEDPWTENICNLIGVDVERFRAGIERAVIKKCSYLTRRNINSPYREHAKYR